MAVYDINTMTTENWYNTDNFKSQQKSSLIKTPEMALAVAYQRSRKFPLFLLGPFKEVCGLPGQLYKLCEVLLNSLFIMIGMDQPDFSKPL